MNNRKEPVENGPKETYRLEAFSDGVFSIAITLLVLELIQFLHPQNGESLLKSYLHHWEPFLAFLIGFLTILVCWINHHHVFDYIKRTDSKLPWVNGFILLMITITPFPTAILAEYLSTEGKLAIAIFGFNYFLIAIGSYWICAYPYNRSLIDEEDREFFNCIKLTYGYSIVYTLVAFIVCFISIPAAIILYLILFYVFAFPKDFAMKLLKRKHKSTRRSGLHKKA
ncbi:MAG TPA: TMEM175 family protein [Chitinophagaceae bacterium]|nr:TMEM175 family protein [Chitinophagaceae bacterium]